MAKYYNYLLYSPVLSWFLAQFSKTVIYYIRNKVLRVERMIGSGGMPSAHSATVCSATTAIAVRYGWASPEFAIMFIVTIIVVYDAVGVRQEAGKHAREINKINRILAENNLKSADIEQDSKITELKEFIGHKPLEAVVGAMLGIVVALLLPIKL